MCACNKRKDLTNCFVRDKFFESSKFAMFIYHSTCLNWIKSIIKIERCDLSKCLNRLEKFIRFEHFKHFKRLKYFEFLIHFNHFMFTKNAQITSDLIFQIEKNHHESIWISHWICSLFTFSKFKICKFAFDILCLYYIFSLSYFYRFRWIISFT